LLPGVAVVLEVVVVLEVSFKDFLGLCRGPLIQLLLAQPELLERGQAAEPLLAMVAILLLPQIVLTELLLQVEALVGL